MGQQKRCTCRFCLSIYTLYFFQGVTTQQKTSKINFRTAIYNFIGSKQVLRARNILLLFVAHSQRLLTRWRPTTQTAKTTRSKPNEQTILSTSEEPRHATICFAVRVTKINIQNAPFRLHGLVLLLDVFTGLLDRAWKYSWLERVCIQCEISPIIYPENYCKNIINWVNLSLICWKKSYMHAYRPTSMLYAIFFAVWMQAKKVHIWRQHNATLMRGQEHLGLI